MPSLYVVATPIGNLEDITLRAIRILKEVKLIAAEDTRKTKQLLSRYNIKTPTTSYHEHNKLIKLDYILNCLEKEDVALVSDAGMPGISDPGHELILTVCERNIPIIPIPGPSVPVTALVISGLPSDSFLYLGFLPHERGNRKRFLKTISVESHTLILFESPHRIVDSLSDLLSILGNRKIAVCRELTKIHEEIFRGTISEAIKHFATPRGEFTLVIAGKEKSDKPVMTSEIKQRLINLCNSGKTAKEVIIEISGDTGLSKKELYQIWIKIKKGANQCDEDVSH
jgi:16S rRNA (cytidine1402-2'-O)-methyltransferase